MQLSELETEYKKAFETVQSDYNWYACHRRGYIAVSWTLRVCAALGLIFGVLLPLLHPTDDVKFLGIRASGPQAAIASLLLAAFLVGLDQVFLVTSSWSRYSVAMLRIKTLLRLYEWDWKILRSGFSPEVDPDGTKRARDLFKNLVAESSKIVETETAAWSSDLAKAVESLAALIKEQRGAMEVQVKELQKTQDEAKKEATQARAEQEKTAEAMRKASMPGAVRLKFEGATNRLQGQVKATLAGVEQVSDAKALSFAFSPVSPGLRDLLVSFQDGSAHAVVLRSVVEVSSGKVTEATITVPGA